MQPSRSCLIYGASGVGKTAFIRRQSDIFIREAGTTLPDWTWADYTLRGQTYSIQLAEYPQVNLATDWVVVIFDLSRPDSLTWLTDEVLQGLAAWGRPTVICGNKNDLPRAITAAEVEARLGGLGLLYLEMSLSNVFHYDRVFQELVRQDQSKPPLHPTLLTTSMGLC